MMHVVLLHQNSGCYILCHLLNFMNAPLISGARNKKWLLNLDLFMAQFILAWWCNTSFTNWNCVIIYCICGVNHFIEQFWWEYIKLTEFSELKFNNCLKIYSIPPPLFISHLILQELKWFTWEFIFILFP